MSQTQDLIHEMYAAFNARDIDGALARMSFGVDWPKASEGGRVIGKEAIREYWTRQWAEFDPHVEPVAVAEGGDGEVAVRVHQVVKTLAGEVISDSVVVHVYSIANGMIERMDVQAGEGETASVSDAFRRDPVSAH